MIEVKDVKKKFIRHETKKTKKEFYAVDGVSLKAEGGKIIGILGPNGAGKTTLLRIIAGIMEPSSGSVTYDSLSFKDNDIVIKKNLAYLSGNTKIYDSISGYELLKMFLEFYDYDKTKIESRIIEISDSLKLGSFLHNRIASLSTGQNERINIARSLVHDPKYYILDEATSGLDIMSSEIILDFIKKERDKGKTILYSTHYMEEAENICDYVIMLNKGTIIKEDTPENIKKFTKTTNLRDAFFALIGGVENE